MPPSLHDWVDPDGLAACLSDLVDELDLSPFLAAHDEPRGMPPYHPRLMLKVLLYGYATGVRSSRRIEERLGADVGFMFLAGQARPDHKTIAEFRRRHLAAFEGLFLEALRLCQKAGMVKLGRVAIDGTKVKANASRHKAMSYGRMIEREAALAAEVRAILDEAEAVDAAEDAKFGDARGDELPDELRRRETRLAKIREAKAALEAEARERTGDPDAVPEAKPAAERRSGKHRAASCGTHSAPPTPQPYDVQIQLKPTEPRLEQDEHVVIQARFMRQRRGVSGARLSAVVPYPTGDKTFTSETTTFPDGRVDLAIPIAPAKHGTNVRVDVLMKCQGETFKRTAGFTVR